MTNQISDPVDAEISAEDLADMLFGTLEPDKSDDKPVTQDGEVEDDKSSEGSQETPTDERRYTEADVRAEAERRVREAVAQAQGQSKQAELEEWLQNASDEDIGKRLREEMAEAQGRSRVTQEVQVAAYQEFLNTLLPADFVAGLTDEDKGKIDPDKFNTDQEFIQAVIDLKASKAASTSYEEEVERRVAAKLEEQKLADKAKNLRSPSPTNTGATQEGNSWDSLKGQAREDALWEAAISE